MTRSRNKYMLFSSIKLVVLQDWQDMASVAGLMYAIGLILRIPRAAGICWFAPVCSSFSWMSRSSNFRCHAFPVGDMSKLQVRLGNMFLARCLLMIRLCASRNLIWILEQPLCSVAFRTPRFQQLLKDLCPACRTIKLWDFGASSSKPLRPLVDNAD